MKTKIVLSIAFICFIFYAGFCQRVGIGTTSPLARLAIDSGILIDQSDLNQGNLVAGALVFGSEGRTGIGRSLAPGSGARNGLGFFTNGSRRMVLDSVGRLGIGTSLPQHTLQVGGNAYFTGNVGLGIANPAYDLEVESFAKIAGHLAVNANPSINYRLLVNGDSYFDDANIGINIVPSSIYSLQAAGSIRFTENVRIDGELNPNNTLIIGNNATVAGSLTVGGRGIVRGSGSAQWRLVRSSVNFSSSVPDNESRVLGEKTFPVGDGTIAGVFMGPVIELGSNPLNVSSLCVVPMNITKNSCSFLGINPTDQNIWLGATTVPTTFTVTLLVYD